MMIEPSGISRFRQSGRSIQPIMKPATGAGRVATKVQKGRRRTEVALLGSAESASLPARIELTLMWAAGALVTIACAGAEAAH